jgi:DNA end-binding protein Ku
VPQDDALLLNTLRYEKELKTPKDLDIPGKLKGARVTAKELDMALRLVDDMADKWHPAKYHDTYHEDLLERIEQKVKAGETEAITEPEKGEKPAKAQVVDLMALLKKSVSHKQKNHSRKRRAA